MEWMIDVKQQDEMICYLRAAYALISFIVLFIQLIRIRRRDPELGWTPQQIFHLITFIGTGVRAIVLGFNFQVFSFKPMVFALVLLDLPGLLFFSTYTYLVRFWVEIYHQTKRYPSENIRIIYYSVNGGIYFAQTCIWIYLWLNEDSEVEPFREIIAAIVSFMVALGFVVYGGKVLLELKRSPSDPKGKTEKKFETVSIMITCSTCFTMKSIMEGLSAVSAKASAGNLNHTALNLYYMLVEIITSIIILCILKKMPPKRVSTRYHPE